MAVTYNASRPNYRPPRFEPRPDLPLIAAIEVFLSEHPGMTAGKFGCLSCGNYYIIRAVKAGSRLMPKTEKSIRDFMRRYVGE